MESALLGSAVSHEVHFSRTDREACWASSIRRPSGSLAITSSAVVMSKARAFTTRSGGLTHAHPIALLHQSPLAQFCQPFQAVEPGFGCCLLFGNSANTEW